MEFLACLRGFGLTTYIILSLAILEWFALSLDKVQSVGIDRETLWNLVTSSLSIMIWLNIPLMCASYTNNKRRCFAVQKVLHLLLSGPILLGLTIMGSYWGLIDYEGNCGALCESFLKDLHWSLLFLVSLVTSTVFLFYLYHLLCFSHQGEDLSRSLFPLEYNDMHVETDDMCAICLQSLKTDQTLGIVKKCKHFFHKDCIESWVAIKNKCPLCRVVV